MAKPGQPTPELLIPRKSGLSIDARLKRLQRLVKLMDQAFHIPGTRITIGLDAIVGLAPVVGDVITAGASIYLVEQARRMGVSKPVLARMYTNVAVDCLAGFFPVVGDLFDVAWKANVKNMKLLEKHVSSS